MILASDGILYTPPYASIVIKHEMVSRISNHLT